MNPKNTVGLDETSATSGMIMHQDPTSMHATHQNSQNLIFPILPQSIPFLEFPGWKQGMMQDLKAYAQHILIPGPALIDEVGVISIEEQQKTTNLDSTVKASMP